MNKRQKTKSTPCKSKNEKDFTLNRDFALLTLQRYVKNTFGKKVLQGVLLTGV